MGVPTESMSPLIQKQILRINPLRLYKARLGGKKMMWYSIDFAKEEMKQAVLIYKVT